MEDVKRKTNSYNRMSFEIAQRKRQQLLDKIHDGFTPKEAMVIWNMKRAHIDVMTEKMRKYGMIVSSGGRCSRIFHKVNKNANQIS